MGLYLPDAEPINQHHLRGLGLSSYARTHIHISVSPIIKCPVVRVSHYKVPNWLFGHRIHHSATDGGAEKLLQHRRLRSQNTGAAPRAT